MLKIKAEKIAYCNTTRVVCNNKVLETQQLNIKTLCDLWKWYFQIPPFEKVELICETRLYNSLRQPTLSSTKSIIDLFREQGIKVVESRTKIVEKVVEDE